MKTSHPDCVLAGLQILVIIAGTFAVRLMTIGYDVTDTTITWNTTALFVRNFGWLFLGVPAIWAIGSLVLERRPAGIWNSWWTIASGSRLFVVVCAIFLHSMFHPIDRFHVTYSC